MLARCLLLALSLHAGVASQHIGAKQVVEVGGVTVERRVVLMGTHLRIEVTARDRTAAHAATERVIAAVRAAEARLSTWRDDTELARWNRATVGEPIAISAELQADLKRATRWSTATRGAFDPGVGLLVEAWALRTGGRQPSAAELERARANGGGIRAAVRFDGDTATRMHDGLRIEEGGFAKGVALDAARVELVEDRAVRSAYLDFGGQVTVVGAPQRWAIADPRDRDRPICALMLSSGSLANSGNSERGIEVDGRRLGHLLDPRTGRPAADFGSLAVWSPDATDADCLSTGLYVLGADGALEFAARQADCEVVVLEVRGDDLRVRASAGLRGRLVPLVPDLKIEFAPAPQGATSTTPHSQHSTRRQ